jgi:3-oxoacyl-[acyl-carrier-protein] synthase III
VKGKNPNILELHSRTAVLYAAGTVMHPSEAKNTKDKHLKLVTTLKPQESSYVIKESAAYAMHMWIKNMKNNDKVVFASINGNTCASSMYSLFEANSILKQNIADEVIIIAEDKISFNSIRIFKEHRIPLVLGDGLAIMRLSKTNINSNWIYDTKWSYTFNNNPFLTTKEGYSKVVTDCDTIKPHGTGTVTNNEAEEDLIKDRKTIFYKHLTGHTQGVSALLEICMLLDDDTIKGNICCIASGLGGFYGSCMLHKGVRNYANQFIQ